MASGVSVYDSEAIRGSCHEERPVPFALAGLLALTSAALRADDTQPATTAGANQPARGAKHGKFRQMLLEKFDTNHNGKLDPDELAKAKEFIKEKLAEIEQKHPELAKKIEEKLAEMKLRHLKGGGAAAGAGNGNGNGNAQKTSATPDSTPPSSAELQKAVDSFNQQGSVKL